MNFRIVKTIYGKEILDTLRDKRTLIAMVGVPVLLYPLIFLVMSQVALVRATKITEKPSMVAIQAEGPGDVNRWLESMEMIQIVELEEFSEDHIEIANGEVDAIVEVDEAIEAQLDGNDTASIRIHYDATMTASRVAANRVEKGLRKEFDRLLEARLASEGLTKNFVTPLDIRQENLAPPSKTVSMILGIILPLMMVIMLAVGAFYPAVDITAGEKERGTFETLLSTPATKLEIVTGKFLTVFTLAMATGILNLASMTATILFQVNQITSQLAKSDGEAAFDLDWISVPPESIVAMAIILVPLAFFISAAMMSVALLAKSFKEAQNYITPFFLALLLPAMISAVPDIELNSATQFIPIANIALLFRDLMLEKATLEMVFTVFLCTAVYALLSLVLAVWMFQREEVILSEERGVPLTLRRSAFVPREVPTTGQSLGIFSMALLFLFYIGSYVQGKDIQIGLLITEYLLLLAPIVFILWFTRVDIAQALNLRRAHAGVYLGSALTSFACLPLLIQFGVWQNRILPVPEEMTRFAERLFDVGNTTLGVPGLIFVMAISPAICEEALFRGVLVSGLRKRLSPWATIVLVGVLFGLFHLSIYRIVPTGLIGILLTYVVVRSGSILPCMLGHFIVNCTSILVQTGNVPAALLRYLEEHDVENTGMPVALLGASLLIFVAGLFLIERFSPPKKTSP